MASADQPNRRSCVAAADPAVAADGHDNEIDGLYQQAAARLAARSGRRTGNERFRFHRAPS
jgi:hypothetical protein